MAELPVDIDLGDEHLNLELKKPYTGNGDPKCPKCFGRGAIDNPIRPGRVPSVSQCLCTYERQVLQNLERAWMGLSHAPLIDVKSPLLGLETQDLWITGLEMHVRSHLRQSLARKGPDWNFKVISDKDLVTAWLSTIALKGQTIMDADAASVSLQYATIEDLAEPPTLLIIWLGVKAAANREMPQVLYEALLHRRHKGKPTWVIDQPNNPLQIGHLCWSDAVQNYCSSMRHVWLSQAMESSVVSLSSLQGPTEQQMHQQAPQVQQTYQPTPMRESTYRSPPPALTARVEHSTDLLEETLARKGKKKGYSFK